MKPGELVGGGLRSRPPTVLKVWLIQWAPGACLTGLAVGGLFLISYSNAAQDDGQVAGRIVFVLVAVTAAELVWGLIALLSLPVFFAARRWIDHVALGVTTPQGLLLASTAVAPVLMLALAFRSELTAVADRREISPAGSAAILIACLALGAYAAGVMWRSAFQPSKTPHLAIVGESVDISHIVQIKEDLEALRMLFGNQLVGALSLFVLLGVPVLAVLSATALMPQVNRIALVPLGAMLVLFPIVIVIGSYQIGLWSLIRIRVSGMLLLAVAGSNLVGILLEPTRVIVAATEFGHSDAVWIYLGLLGVLTVPALLLNGSAVRMSIRFMKSAPRFDPVARGWRPWPTNFWGFALRTLCLPSFLVALPRGRTVPLGLFALAAILSTLYVGVVLALVTQLPHIFVATTLRPASNGGLAVSWPGFDVLSLVLAAALGVSIFWFLAKMAGVTYGHAQRRTALAYQRVIDQDARRPILFLRSFRQDPLRLAPSARSLLARILRLGERRRTLDEIVLDAASPVGPVIALAAPKEPVAPLGAARLHAEDSEWRGVVRNLAERSRAVIINLDETESVLWEFEHLLAAGHANKTLCILAAKPPSETARTIDRMARQSSNAAVRRKLDDLRSRLAAVSADKLAAGASFATDDVTLIVANNASDYTHWCLVNLLLLSLASDVSTTPVARGLS